MTFSRRESLVCAGKIAVAPLTAGADVTLRARVPQSPLAPRPLSRLRV